MAQITIFTIGHSTRVLDDFLGLLKANGIQEVVDVRTVPRSRFNPQYNIETLPAGLEKAGIEYTHMAGLGGLRHPQKESINTAWKNASFRAFADYMQTPEFEENLRALMELAGKKRTALMCAESVPWRCHRSLIADALTVRGVRVEHITGYGKNRPHELTPFAKVEHGRVYYPAEPAHSRP